MGYRKYSDAFKREVLGMVAEGSRSVAQLERDLDITPGLIYKWQRRHWFPASSCVKPSMPWPKSGSLADCQKRLLSSALCQIAPSL
jgi:transposase-like protein